MRIYQAILLSAALAVSVPAGADPTYRWVDEDGVVHYSDRPQEGAEQIDLRPLPGISNPSRDLLSQLTRSDSGTEAESTSDDASYEYESLEITSPVPEQTVWNIATVLQVDLAVRPSLAPGHQFRVLFDGNPVEGGTTTQPSLSISEVYRGAHTIQAQIVDTNGATVIQTDPFTFYVQQTTVRN
jgi:hypothetical protein